MSPNPCYGLGTFRAAYLAAKFLPRSASQALAGFIGRTSFRFAKQSRSSLRENLRLVTGLDGPELEALCSENFENFLKMLADYFYCTAGRGRRAVRLLEEWRGMANLRSALDRGNGVILITAHLGNWELGGILLALENLPMTVVTLKEPTTGLSRWRDAYRRELGIKTIVVGSDNFSFVDIIKTLRGNGIVAMLVERPHPGSGSPVRFFGQDTFFSAAPALLWQHTDAAVLPAFVLQNKKGRYLSFADPSIPMERHDDQREGIAKNTQRIATAFEAIIREHPEQWFNYVPIWKNEN